MSDLLQKINSGRKGIYVSELTEARKKQRDPGQIYASNIRKEREVRNELWYKLANDAVEYMVNNHLDAVVEQIQSISGYSTRQWTNRGWTENFHEIKTKEQVLSEWNKIRDNVFEKRDTYSGQELIPGLHLAILPQHTTRSEVSLNKLFGMAPQTISRAWEISCYWMESTPYKEDIQSINQGLRQKIEPVVENFLQEKFGPLAQKRVLSSDITDRDTMRLYNVHVGYQQAGQNRRPSGFFMMVVLPNTKTFAARGSVDIVKLRDEVISVAKLAHTTPNEVLDAIVQLLKKNGNVKTAENTVKEHVEAIKRGPVTRNGQLGLRERTLSLLERSEREQPL